MEAESFNFVGQNASNVFPCEEEKEKILPVGLFKFFVDLFSFPGQWILDMTRSKGNYASDNRHLNKFNSSTMNS